MDLNDIPAICVVGNPYRREQIEKTLLNLLAILEGKTHLPTTHIVFWNFVSKLAVESWLSTGPNLKDFDVSFYQYNHYDLTQPFLKLCLI